MRELLDVHQQLQNMQQLSERRAELIRGLYVEDRSNRAGIPYATYAEIGRALGYSDTNASARAKDLAERRWRHKPISEPDI